MANAALKVLRSYRIIPQFEMIMARPKKKSETQFPVIEVVPEPANRAEALVALGLNGPASDDEVRSAFRMKLKDAHPDLNGGTDALLRRLLMAREMLMSDNKVFKENTDSVQNLPKPPSDMERSVRLDISLDQALRGGETTCAVPALEASAPDELLTSLTQMKTLRVSLTAGLRNGDIVRVKTEGAVREEQLFRIHIVTGDGVRVWGHDIWMTGKVEARIFATGGLAAIDTPHGVQDVAIAKDAPQGSSLCLKGLGLPATEACPAGDLHVRLEAMLHKPASYAESLTEFRMKWAS